MTSQQNVEVFVKQSKISKYAKAHKLCCVSVAIFDISIIIISIIILAISGSLDNELNTDLAVVEQIKYDWSQKFYIDFQSRSENFSCHEDEEPAFTWTYQGTVDGCVIENNEVVTETDYHSSWKGKFWNKRKNSCQKIAAIPPKNITGINGTTVCGQMGDANFLNFKRMDPETEKCPDGMQPCSPNTSIKNTVCYPNGTDNSQCPITGITFIKKNTRAEQQFEIYNNSQKSWTKRDAYPGYVLFYSKTEQDNLPLTSFLFTHLPCLDPLEIQTYPRDMFYILEKQQRQLCQPEFNTEIAYDERYKYLNFAVDQFQLLDENGIFDQLEQMPNYQIYVPDAQRVKGKSMLYLYGRSVIDWQGCQQKNMTGFYERIKESSKIQLHKIPSGYTANLYALIFTLVCGAINLLSCLVSHKDNLALPLIVTILKAPTQIYFAIPAFYYAVKADEQVQTARTRINAAAIINGCSDQYTYIDLDKFEYLLERLDQKMGGSPILTWSLLIAFILSVSALIFAQIFSIIQYCLMRKTRKEQVTDRDNDPEKEVADMSDITAVEMVEQRSELGDPIESKTQ